MTNKQQQQNSDLCPSETLLSPYYVDLLAEYWTLFIYRILQKQQTTLDKKYVLHSVIWQQMA